jgi:hypothetical protein
MRKMLAVGFLVIVAAITASGCATGPTTLASPSPEIPDCRNQGFYNRAANLCVSGGP